MPEVSDLTWKELGGVGKAGGGKAGLVVKRSQVPQCPAMLRSLCFIG